MKSATTLRIAFPRARCYSFSHRKTSLPPLSQTAIEFTTNSPIRPILDQRPSRTNFYSPQRKNTPTARRCLSAAPKDNDNDPLRRTALYDLHVENKATMVPFGGYSMPVRYADLTISESHHWTRNKASLFDVGHMVQHNFQGPGTINFLQRITPSSIAGLPPGRSTYSCFLYPGTGVIVDDIVISRPEYGRFHVVSNAGSRKKVDAYIMDRLIKTKDLYEDVFWHVSPDQGLIALQGPLSAEIMKDFLGSQGSGLTFQPDLDLNTFYFGQVEVVTVAGLPNDAQAEVMISRGGYTGEDGFELSIPPAYTTEIVKHLLRVGGLGRLRLAGLGARDSLRLEAGLCLYGQDIDESTTPVEAAIGWIVHPDRRTKDSAGFHGSSVILSQLGIESPRRRRVGMIIETRPARAGAEILRADVTQPEASKLPEGVEQHETLNSSKVIKQPVASEPSEGFEQSAASELPEALEQPSKVIGKVTSGCPSPTLGQNIAMGYVDRKYAKSGTELRVMVGGKERKATVVKMPFVKANRWLPRNTPRPVIQSKPA